MRRPNPASPDGERTPYKSDLRADGAAALEWAARYLERVGELPVLAQVQPGELTSRRSCRSRRPSAESPLRTCCATSTS